MKELKRRLLFVLASDVDVFDTKEAFSYWRYGQVYWRMEPFARASVRGGMNQLVKAGMAARIVRDGEPQFRLAATGRDQLLSFFSAGGRLGRRWDRAWRMVILDRGTLNQSYLRKLRALLEEFGFVRLEAGVFVAPVVDTGELKRRLIGRDLLRAVTVVETKRFVVGDDRAFADRIWGLDGLVKRYQGLISLCQRLLDKVKRAKVLTDQQKIEYRKCLKEWFGILSDSPGLPSKLLPHDWPHGEAQKIAVGLGKMMRRTEEEESFFTSVL